MSRDDEWITGDELNQMIEDAPPAVVDWDRAVLLAAPGGDVTYELPPGAVREIGKG